jgi:ATP-dependent DNA ligase
VVAVQLIRPQLAFDVNAAHEITAGESTEEYLKRLLAPVPREGWVMEPKLDGNRWQVHIDDPATARSADGHELERHERSGSRTVRSIGGRNGKEHDTPAALKRAVEGLPGGTVLDGELLLSPPPQSATSFVVFDVLAWPVIEGNVMELSWENRRLILDYAIKPALVGDFVQLVPVGPVDEDVLVSWVVEHGMEGAVCKRKSASYRPGSRRRDAFVKIKPKQTTDAIVYGFEMGEGQSNRDRCRCGWWRRAR